MCHYVPVDDICNDACQSKKPEITIKRNSTTGALIITMKSGRDQKEEELNDDYGFPDNDKDDHHTEIVDVQTSGIYGLVVTEISQSPLQQNVPSTRTRRAATNNDTSPGNNKDVPKIHNPFICMAIESAILFKIKVNEVNRSLSHYPRYNKDHLFNENDRFDYGNFRLLHSLIRETNKSLSTFINVFNQAGVFVFYDNAEPAREMIVKITSQGEKCSGYNNQILPTSSNILTQYRVSKSEVSTFFSFLTKANIIFMQT